MPPRSSYECHDCSKTFSSQQALEQHTRDKYHGIECDYCGRAFGSEEACKQHTNAVHPHIACTECTRTFQSLDDLEQHQQDKHPSFECDYCDRVFKSADACYQHEGAVHPHTCDECNRTFSSSYGLEDHMRDKHPSFECDYCDRVFGSAQACEQHEAAVHSHECDECDKLFHSAFALEQHKRDKHPSFGCDECSKTFSSFDALEQHKRDKHPSFGCNYCNRVFGSAEARSMHETITHPRHWCEKCGMLFLSSDALEEHKRTKHPSFKCNYCSRVFASTETREQHESAAHPIHPCDKCDKRFSSSNMLQKHKQDVHPLYKCNFCDFDFVSANARDQHQETTHSNLSIHCDDGVESAIVHNLNLDHHCTEQLKSLSEMPHLDNSFLTPHPNSNVESVNAPPFSLKILCKSPEPSLPRSQSQELVSAPVSRASHPYSRDGLVSASDVLIPDDPSREPTNNDSPDRSRESSAGEQQTARFCLSCQGIFDTDEDFRNHACKSHGSEIPACCSYCCIQFGNEDALEKQLSERAPLPCKMCGLQLCSEVMLQDHLESHPTCRKCGMLFGNEPELYRHTEIEHPVIVCWDCDAVISQESLPSHLASTHPSCPICDLRMRESSMLDEHINNEHSEGSLSEHKDPQDSGEHQSGNGQSNIFAKPLNCNELMLLKQKEHREESSVSSESHPSFTPPSTLDEKANGTITSRTYRSEESPDELHQTAPSLLAPFISGNNDTKSEAVIPVAQGSLHHSQLESPGSSVVITESYDGMRCVLSNM
ncbi:hypothetical protein J3A83DRAFT_4229431 [Scleroderma citrinum]